MCVKLVYYGLPKKLWQIRHVWNPPFFLLSFNTHTHTHVHTHTHTHMHACTHVCTHACMHTHTNTHKGSNGGGLQLLDSFHNQTQLRLFPSDTQLAFSLCLERWQNCKYIYIDNDCIHRCSAVITLTLMWFCVSRHILFYRSLVS